MSVPQPISPKSTGVPADQTLETWKEIAIYLNRDLRTVKRWEQTRALPVHRLPGGPQAAVYAFKSELDAWRRSGGLTVQKIGGIETSEKWTRIHWTASVAMLLAMSGICLWVFWPVETNPVPRVSSLTTLPGVEWFPAFSPDGKAVAFSWNGEQENNYDIYVMLLNGGKPLRLTSDPAMDLAPAWSPDGSRVAFLRWRLGESKTERLIVPALGGPERIIAEGMIRPAATGISFPLMAWTPDGSRLIGGGDTSTGAYALRLISIETGETVKWLTSPPPDSPGDCCPTVSPDGRTLAFLRGSPARIYKPVLLDIAPGGEPSGGLRTLDVPSCSNPLWSGNSRDLLCVVADGETRTLWRIPLRKNRTAYPLPLIGALGQHLTISPHGDRLVYSNFSWEDDIWQTALSGGTPPVRLISSTADDLRPQYSPDGKKIAFLSNRSGHLAVWVSGQDGGNASLLATAAAPHSPSWSPDGRQIVYTCRVGVNTEDICVIGSGGGTPRQLTKHPARDMLPGWSRDGRWIYFASDRSGTFQTYRIAADGSAPVQVTRNGGFGGVESADRRFLFYGKAILSSQIYRVPVGGGDEVPVADGVRSLRLPLNFAVNEDGIIFASSDDMTRRFELRRYLLASGKTEVIARIERGLGNGISLSPDGRSILFTTMELHSGDLFMVENFRPTL